MKKLDSDGPLSLGTACHAGNSLPSGIPCSSNGFSFVYRLALSLISALLCALAQPNELFLYGNWGAGALCLVPLYLALSGTWRYIELMAIGALFGALHHALTSYWLFFYKGFAFWTLGTTTIAYAVIYSVSAAYAGFLLQHSRNVRPLVFALAWAFFEYSKSIGFLGYPWGLVPYSFTAIPLMLQTADLWGVYGLSAIMAFWAGLIGEWFLYLPKRSSSKVRQAITLKWLTAGALALLLFVVAYGEMALHRSYSPYASIRLLLCQQNTDPWIEGEQAALSSNLMLARQALDRNRTDGGRPPDLIVFSETSLRRPFAEYRSWFERNPPKLPLLPFLQREGIPLLTGLPVIIDWEKFTASNAVGLISPEGRLLATYAKMHPVPFAEAIPFWEYSWFRSFIQRVIGLESGWVMGTERVLFTLPASAPVIRFATPICFEDAFADLCRKFVLDGADLFINLTNDSWSRTQSAQIQHYAVARFRAIEHRRTLVRSTNSGVTCVIDADGRSILELPQFQANSAIVDVPVYHSPLTIYAVS
ncbi:MAG: apolipoprotein N-acyltransferase, partial [Rectinema sp.]|nr:apolipoprotein N-acyltransferase [Rectinema sp.]